MPTNTSYKGIALLIAIFSFWVLQWNLPNLGGNLNPRSFFAWAVLGLSTTWLWLTAIRYRQLVWHSSFGALFLPPLVTFVYAVLGPSSAFENYPTLAVFALLVAALWVIGLAQLKLTNAQWFVLAWIIFVGCAVLCTLNLIGPKYFRIQSLYNHLPIELMAIHGGFQQPNNFGSFLAASLTFAYLCLVNSQAADRKAYLWWFAILATVVSTMIWLAGSRTGYLGLLIAASICGIWTATQKRAHLSIYAIWWLAIAVGLCIALQADKFNIDGNYWVQTRLSDLPNGEATTYRKNMWLVTLSAWTQAPLLGHGLGSFTEIFMPELQRLATTGTVFPAQDNLTHPHNELVLWLAETGIVGTLLVFAPWVILVLTASKTIWLKQSGWLAALAPIALHTQTEFPLHGSGAHWLLLGLILAQGLSALTVSVKPMTMPRPVWLAAISSTASVGILSAAFLIHTGYTSYQAYFSFYHADIQQVDLFEAWTQSPEFSHPLLGQHAQDTLVINSVPLFLTSPDLETKRMGCQMYQNYYRRYKNKDTEEKLKQCPP